MGYIFFFDFFFAPSKTCPFKEIQLFEKNTLGDCVSYWRKGTYGEQVQEWNSHKIWKIYDYAPGRLMRQGGQDKEDCNFEWIYRS